MKIIQIFDNKAHWITPYTTLEDIPQHPASDIYVEADDDVQEGWYWNGTTFTPPYETSEEYQLIAEINAINGELHRRYRVDQFDKWLETQMPKGRKPSTKIVNRYIRYPYSDRTTAELVEIRDELIERLEELQTSRR